MVYYSLYVNPLLRNVLQVPGSQGGGGAYFFQISLKRPIFLPLQVMHGHRIFRILDNLQ